jgi:TonB family protein
MSKKMFLLLTVFFVSVLLFNSRTYSQDLPKFDASGKSKGTVDKGAKTAEPDINAFIPVEKQPSVLKRATPTYPPLAHTARIEGQVWIKVLVEKNGKAKKAVVIKTDAEVFNESAEKAALESKYEPAVMNGMNVDCWVVVTYNFKIK